MKRLYPIFLLYLLLGMSAASCADMDSDSPLETKVDAASDDAQVFGTFRVKCFGRNALTDEDYVFGKVLLDGHEGSEQKGEFPIAVLLHGDKWKKNEDTFETYLPDGSLAILTIRGFFEPLLYFCW